MTKNCTVPCAQMVPNETAHGFINLPVQGAHSSGISLMHLVGFGTCCSDNQAPDCPDFFCICGESDKP
jgi:hypothetical protein